jgi:hypothetical protein
VGEAVGVGLVVGCVVGLVVGVGVGVAVGVGEAVGVGVGVTVGWVVGVGVGIGENWAVIVSAWLIMAVVVAEYALLNTVAPVEDIHLSNWYPEEGVAVIAAYNVPAYEYEPTGVTVPPTPAW